MKDSAYKRALNKLDVDVLDAKHAFRLLKDGRVRDVAANVYLIYTKEYDTDDDIWQRIPDKKWFDLANTHQGYSMVMRNSVFFTQHETPETLADFITSVMDNAPSELSCGSHCDMILINWFKALKNSIAYKNTGVYSERSNPVLASITWCEEPSHYDLVMIGMREAGLLDDIGMVSYLYDLVDRGIWGTSGDKHNLLLRARNIMGVSSEVPDAYVHETLLRLSPTLEET